MNITWSTSTISIWGLALFLIPTGLIATAIVIILMGFAGAPGAMLGALLSKRSENQRIPTAALLVSMIGQLAVSMLWMAFLFQSVNYLLGDAEGIGPLVAKTVAYIFGILPSALAAQEAVQVGKSLAQHRVAPGVSNLSFLIGLILIFSPSITSSVFGWVPHWGTFFPRSPSTESRLQFADDLRHSSKVLEHISLAQEVDSQRSQRATADPELDRQVYVHFDAAIAASNEISDEFLDWLHPEMREEFRKKLMHGHSELLAGYRSSDLLRQVRGIRLIEEWYEKFWEHNGPRILQKAFGD